MRTRNSNFPNNSNITIPRRQNKGRAPNIVEPELRTIIEVAPNATYNGRANSITIRKGMEKLSEAWERFKEMLRACPHHGFTELTQIDTFYNGLNDNDQDSLNAARVEILINFRLSTKENAKIKMDERINKLADQLSTLVEIVSKKVVTSAPVKAMRKLKMLTIGVAYEGPSIPTNPSPKKVVERETEETTDKEQSNFQGSTAQIPPPVTPISIPEPDVPRLCLKPLPYTGTR
ncbi:reverse transcriptase domain-containing protein [Tanacetum coccineum]